MPGQINGYPFSLRFALDSLTLPLSNEARESLRTLVFEYVDGLKAAGRPPAQAIVAVKKLAMDAGFPTTSHIVYSEKLIGPDAFVVELVGWCIERYYGPGSA